MEKKRTYFIDIDGTIFKYRKFETYETTEVEVIPSTLDSFSLSVSIKRARNLALL